MAPKETEKERGAALLLQLVRTCVHLAYLAGKAVRAVQRDREQSGSAALGASLKDATDTRSYLTTADLRAQKVIVDGLRQAFPRLVLVSEEEENGDSAAEALADPGSWYPYAVDDDKAGFYRPVSLTERDLPVEYGSVELTELVVFIDPVDGTREFVEGRLDSVQTLIGIAWRGRPIAGVVGLPFHHHEVGVIPTFAVLPPSKAAGAILHGVVGVGLFGLRHPLDDEDEPTSKKPRQQETEVVAPAWRRSHAPAQLIAATSKSVKESILSEAHAVIGGEPLIAGGCGNKIVRLCTGQADVTLFNLGTCLLQKKLRRSSS